ncbi:MAG TPA: hypothetical protein VMU88_03660 [bacterium]|nr:hypothetical protein [bacterium]
MMNLLRRSSEKPQGQVLLATLFFCFIFAVLFVGVYKSGVLYGLKERSNRACELTALSAGAVYANGLQWVRLTNLFLVTFAILDLTVIAAAVAAAGAVSFGALAGIALKSDPHFRQKVQKLQSLLFGINLSVPGLYPSLIFAESLSVARKNNLSDNWFKPGGPLSFQVPLPPSPAFLFNSETTSPLWTALVPSMSLRFRTADQFIQDQGDSESQKVYYQYQDQKTGTYHYVEEKDTELAPNSTNPGQRRVKQGLEGSGKLLKLEPVVLGDAEREAQAAAQSDIEKSGLRTATQSFKAIAPLLRGILLDVTDKTDPPDHTFIAYTQLPTSLPPGDGSPNPIQSIAEISVEGPGLAAWDLTAPAYQSRRIHLKPERLAEILVPETVLQSLVQSGKIPAVPNLFSPAAFPGGF